MGNGCTTGGVVVVVVPDPSRSGSASGTDRAAPVPTVTDSSGSARAGDPLSTARVPASLADTVPRVAVAAAAEPGTALRSIVAQLTAGPAATPVVVGADEEDGGSAWPGAAPGEEHPLSSSAPVRTTISPSVRTSAS